VPWVVHRDTIKNWGKRYNPELGKAVVEAKQRWGREKSIKESLEYLEQNPLQEPDMEEPLPPSPEELEREKWRRIFQDIEDRSHKQMLEDERALAERADIPPEMKGIGLG
jgi:transposase